MKQELIIKPTLEDVLNSNISRRTLLKGFALGGAALGASSCVQAFGVRPTIKHESQNFIYNLPDDLSKAAVAYIMEEHERGLTELEKRLRLGQDYGRKLGGKITVGVIPSGANFSNLDRGTIDYNRGALSSGTMQATMGPLIHEPTHHYTRSAGDFYSEGLAVYMQEQIGRNPAYPNYGVDLHRKIADMELAPLSKFIGIRGLSRTLVPEESDLAYLQAGSFVKYLVEDVSKGDARQFMKLFVVGGDYKDVFGKSFDELEQGWREKIKNTKPIYALSDALKVEHLNPRLQPSGKLDDDRERIVRLAANSRTLGGGHSYPIWVDVRLESRSEHIIEIVGYYVDNIYKGERIGGAGDYTGRPGPLTLKRRLKMLGNKLEPNQIRLVKDYPVTMSSTWPGKEFAVHYIFRTPNISNEEMDVPIRMQKI